MKKIFTLCLLVLISGCSSNVKTTETKNLENTSVVQEKEITEEVNLQEEESKELTQAEKDSNFEKNQECAEWLPKIQEMEINYQKESPEWKANVEEVFYSPKTNSCLYITHIAENYPWPAIKTLMDVSYAIGANPVNDISCTVSKGCDDFYRIIEEEYKK